MAGGSNRTSSSKELTAIIMNLKESRVLEKSVQTLSLEESYAAKLLDLNSKMVKFNYKRLKNNVGKIRTNLKPEDITAMRSLEMDDKFKPEHPMICNSSSATKIAAANKRLNLNSYRRQRSQSAMPRIRHQHQQTRLAFNPVPTRESSESSSNREHDSCQTTPTPSDITTPQFSCSRKKLRPKTTAVLRQSTTHENETPRPKSMAANLEMITRAQKANKIQAPQVTFSCHEEKSGEEHEKSRAGNGKNVPDAFGPNPYEERRHKFMQMEGQMFVGLSQRKQNFVARVERFAAENPPIAVVEPDLTQKIIDSIDSMASRTGRKQSSGVALKAKYIECPILRQFAEIRKTRYLRVRDSQLDLVGGTNTLGQDYLKRTMHWRNWSSKPMTFEESVTVRED